jgi:hypothetical protein
MGESDDRLSGARDDVVSENSKIRASIRHLIGKKQGCRYNGRQHDGDKPELKQWSFDLYVRSPVENSGMR